ncbi:MAG: hypothetical protein HY721_03285 [Planctomycetes bacterium]|nr:hypothetical protein [Planctomycetota bacterium]
MARASSRGRSGEELLRFEPSSGDFPHARRRGAKLACCTCTTCCFTVLLGGIGAVAGVVHGVIAFVARPPSESESWLRIVGGILRLLLYVLGFGLAYLLLGAFIGFCIDLGYNALA